jgi:hypothetical protein
MKISGRHLLWDINFRNVDCGFQRKKDGNMILESLLVMAIRMEEIPREIEKKDEYQHWRAR